MMRQIINGENTNNFNNCHDDNDTLHLNTATSNIYDDHDLVLSYVAEWFDPHPEITKRYLLNFFVNAQEVEMKEIPSGRKFLKRTKIQSNNYNSNGGILSHPMVINDSFCYNERGKNCSSMNNTQHCFKNGTDNITKKWTKEDFYMGEEKNIIIFSRDLKLIDYGDKKTRAIVQDDAEKTVVIITPPNYHRLGKVIQTIEECESNNFTLVNLKAFIVNPRFLQDTAILLRVNPNELISSTYVQQNDAIDEKLSSLNTHVEEEIHETMKRSPGDGLTVAVAFRGKNSIKGIHSLLEKLDNSTINYSCPHKVYKSKLIAASSIEEVAAFTELFLDHCHETTAMFNNKSIAATCCVIKPHIIIQDRKTGKVIQDIMERGYQITAMQLFRLERQTAAEFYEVYDGWSNNHQYNDADNPTRNFKDMVDELSSGPVIALELLLPPTMNEQNEIDVVSAFRSSAGPWDIEIAHKLQPDSLRSKYGQPGHGRKHNAIHCTDLPEDATSELAYFFDILSKK